MGKPLSEDWRLTDQEDYLKRRTLLHTHYIQPSPNWDHDHCVFCWGKIDEKTHSSYVVEDDARFWICEECYEDFKEMFEWTVK
ncbi:MAG: hypothetical protein IJP38_03625 [Oscillospiraceae bacterium]|nr:hypothetical protein [Oscillospiraceae bacterium]